jgi:transcriptional regulator with XRE-family HTH domain
VEWGDKSVDFGQRLRELRKQSGLTQKQLGERIGVTKSVVSFYELQERSPSPDVLIKLSGIFHVSTDFLLGIEKNKTVDVSGLDDEDINVVKSVAEALRRKNKSAEKV